MSEKTALLGDLLNGNETRDAVHLAIAPMVAGERLKPGQHVGIMAGGLAGVAPHPIGIVDPFLRGDVDAGDRFYLALYPGTITSLRHDWSHPSFAGETPVYSGSESWIREFAGRVGLKYEIIMEGARDWVGTHDGKWGREYLCFGGLLEGEYVPDEFWPHYEAVTGTTVAETHRGSFFSCSC